tara:strand:+ start:42 stop:929 length:888 start_codon:yes stop_codon:yes gene_type:complete
MDEFDYSHIKSYWNSHHSGIRKSVFNSTKEEKIVLVEGVIDAKLLSILKINKSIIPIPASNLKSEKNSSLIFVDRPQEDRGKGFIIKALKTNLSNCFGLVDMDHDYEQKKISNLNGKIIDSKMAMGSVGKIIGEKRKEKFMQELFHELSKNGSTRSIDEYYKDDTLLSIIIEILGMEKFLRGLEKANPLTQCTEIFELNYEEMLEILPKRPDLKSKILKSKIPFKDIFFIRDHDLVNVFLWYSFDIDEKTNEKEFRKKRHLVTRIFEKLIKRYTKSSEQKIFIENDKIYWETKYS